MGRVKLSTVASEWRKAGMTAALSSGGALLFMAVGIPAAPILGAMAAVAAASIAGARLGFHSGIRAPQLAVMGIAAGTTITPAALAAAAAWPLSILALIVVTVLMQLCAYGILRRFGRFDPLTAFLAAAPGSLSAVLIIAEERGANVPRVAIPQTIRVTGIVALTPILLAGAPQPIWLPQPALLHGVAAWLLLLIVSGIGWATARRLRWPLPPFLGCLVGSGAVHVGGTVSLHMPGLVVTIALVGLGGVIGSRFSGMRARDILSLVPVSLGVMLVTGLIGVGAGTVAGHALGIGTLPGLLAFAPGSMEMMISIAVTLNLQPAYVAAHHIVRTLLLLSVVPLLARRPNRITPSA